MAKQQSPNFRISADTKDLVNSLITKVFNRGGFKPTQDDVIAAAVAFAKGRFEEFGQSSKYFGQQVRVHDKVQVTGHSQLCGQVGEVLELFTVADMDMARVEVQGMELTFTMGDIEFVSEIDEGDSVRVTTKEESFTATVDGFPSEDDTDLVTVVKPDGTKVTVDHTELVVTYLRAVSAV